LQAGTSRCGVLFQINYSTLISNNPFTHRLPGVPGKTARSGGQQTACPACASTAPSWPGRDRASTGGRTVQGARRLMTEDNRPAHFPVYLSSQRHQNFATDLATGWNNSGTEVHFQSLQK